MSLIERNLGIYTLTLACSISLATLAEESLPLYQCYSELRARGDVESANAVLDKIAKVVSIHNRIHSMEKDGTVQVRAIANVVGLNRDDAKSRISDQAIQMYFSVTNKSPATINSIFLGCTEISLKR